MMKIYDRGVGTAGQTDAARTQETSRGGRSGDARPVPANQSAGDDTVHLSTAAGSLRRALDVSAASRARNIEALQAAYRSGGYVADSYQTSRAMVREALTGGVA